MKKTVSLTTMLFLWVTILLGQSDIEKKFVFDSNSSNEEMEIEIGQDTKVLTITMNGQISMGTLKVGLFRPNGDRSGGFELKASGETSGSSNISINTSSNSSSISVSSGSSSNSASSGSSTTSVSSGSSTTRVSSGSSETRKSSGSKGSSASVINIGNRGAKGNMSEVVTSPEPGTWKIKINPDEVDGTLSLKIEKD